MHKFTKLSLEWLEQEPTNEMNVAMDATRRLLVGQRPEESPLIDGYREAEEQLGRLPADRPSEVLWHYYARLPGLIVARFLLGLDTNEVLAKFAGGVDEAWRRAEEAGPIGAYGLHEMSIVARSLLAAGIGEGLDAELWSKRYVEFEGFDPDHFGPDALELATRLDADGPLEVDVTSDHFLSWALNIPSARSDKYVMALLALSSSFPGGLYDLRNRLHRGGLAFDDRFFEGEPEEWPTASLKDWKVHGRKKELQLRECIDAPVQNPCWMFYLHRLIYSLMRTLYFTLQGTVEGVDRDQMRKILESPHWTVAYILEPSPNMELMSGPLAYVPFFRKAVTQARTTLPRLGYYSDRLRPTEIACRFTFAIERDGERIELASDEA